MALRPIVRALVVPVLLGITMDEAMFLLYAAREGNSIEHALREFEGRFLVVPLPNITHVFYGRDVGYAVERIDLDLSLQAISASDLRRRLSRRAERL